MKAIFFAIITLFTLAIGLSFAYAEQQATVILPFERPYQEFSCTAWPSFIGERTVSTTDAVRYQCTWIWTLADDTINAMPEYPLTGSLDPETIKIWLEEIVSFVENNPFQEPEESIEVEDLIDEPSPTPFSQLDPEVRKALGQLKICQLGQDEWIAIIPQYNLTTSDEAPIFKHLGKDRQLMQLALDYQECRGNTEYPWLSQQYNDTYTADQEGMKLALARGGEDTRRYMAEGKTASAEEKLQAIADATDYMCKPANLHLKLCSAYQVCIDNDLSDGDKCLNRGSSEPSIGEGFDNVNIFAEGGDPQTGEGIIEEYRRTQAANIQTEQDLKNYYDKVQQAVCDNYVAQYKYLERDDFENYPQWLIHCID